MGGARRPRAGGRPGGGWRRGGARLRASGPGCGGRERAPSPAAVARALAPCPPPSYAPRALEKPPSLGSWCGGGGGAAAPPSWGLSLSLVSLSLSGGARKRSLGRLVGSWFFWFSLSLCGKGEGGRRRARARTRRPRGAEAAAQEGSKGGGEVAGGRPGKRRRVLSLSRALSRGPPHARLGARARTRWGFRVAFPVV